GAGASARGRCACGLSFGKGELDAIEWSNDFESRVKDVDWGALAGDADKRWRIAFLIGKLATHDGDALPALAELEPFLRGALVERARPFLHEAIAHTGPRTAAALTALVSRS